MTVENLLAAIEPIDDWPANIIVQEPNGWLD